MAEDETRDTARAGSAVSVVALPVGQLAANCYLVTDIQARETLVLDPGADAPAILEALSRLGTRVVGIAHTHGHFDHISATEAVQRELPARVPIWAHAADNYLYTPEARARGALFGYALPDAPLAPDHALADGDALRVGAALLRVLHTPGHTPGSISLLGDELLFSGDTLFRRGIGRTDLEGGDEEAIYTSIATRLYPLPEALRVLPGHGAPTTIGEERRQNPFIQA